MSQLIDFSKLPAPKIIEEIRFEEILADNKQYFLSLYPIEDQEKWAAILALESEPAVKILEALSYRETIWRQRLNEAAVANMLSHSTSSDLDNLAANFKVKRKLIQEARPEMDPPLGVIWESDNELRERSQSAFEGLSVAGPRAAYEFHALSAHALVADVSATSPSPAAVTVTVMSRQGSGEASKEVLEAVAKAVNAENVRPLGDRVTVQSAKIKEWALEANLFIYPGPEIEPILAAAKENAIAYATKQRRLGLDITISAIHAALHVEGVQRVEVNNPPQNIILDKTEAGFCTNIIINIGGTDE